jgi:hypothetical protein
MEFMQFQAYIKNPRLLLLVMLTFQVVFRLYDVKFSVNNYLS